MLFGTDGVRDIAANILNNDVALKLGKATASLKKGAKIAVAFDTRLSGKAIESQFIEGVLAAGGRVVECGLMPTPCLAYITYLSGSDYGAMISASHNPPEYNGIKIFDGGGNKLSLQEENKVEEIYNAEKFLTGCGEFTDGTFYRKGYIDRVVKEIDCDFSGVEVSLDCCFGATAHIAPKIFKKLGAKVYGLCNSYNGKLVNVYSGATHTDYLVANTKSRLGFTFDGDGDRVIGVLDGAEIDGDCMLYYIAKYLDAEGKLTPPVVVGTKMTNTRLSEIMENHGVELLRADVGDKYVLEMMKSSGAVLGGEQAGHIIIKNEIATGDGILAAAYMTKYFVNGDSLTEYVPYPLMKRNYRVNLDILTDVRFLEEMKLIELQLEGSGRCLLRKSGTEPLIRVLVEGKNAAFVGEIIAQIDALMVKYCRKM